MDGYQWKVNCCLVDQYIWTPQLDDKYLFPLGLQDHQSLQRVLFV